MSAASRGNHCFCCASLAQRLTAFTTSVLCTSTSTATAGSTVDMASIAKTASKKLPAAPPNPQEPQCPSVPIQRAASPGPSANCCSWIHRQATFGAIVSSANLRTVAKRKSSPLQRAVSVGNELYAPTREASGIGVYQTPLRFV